MGFLNRTIAQGSEAVVEIHAVCAFNIIEDGVPFLELAHFDRVLGWFRKLNE